MRRAIGERRIASMFMPNHDPSHDDSIAGSSPTSDTQGADAPTVEPGTTEAPFGDGALPEGRSERRGLIRRALGGVARFAMRAAIVYLVLFAYPFPLLSIPDVRRVPQIWHDKEVPTAAVNWDTPDWVDKAYTWRGEHASDWSALERQVVDRVAADAFGFTETLQRPRGSGDTTFGYIRVATRAGCALGIALAWSLIALVISRFTGRRWRLLGFLGPWMHLAGRYYLATVLMGYGLAKVYPSQFSFPSLSRLETPYGDGSPMNILWSFMGSSSGYIVFSGIMEVLPALLLFFRRTALVGALLAAAVMANVVLLNYCYDVPVKILSTHLLVFALALASVDLKRMVNIFLLNRPAPPRDLSRPSTGWTGHVVRLLILVPFLGLGADRVIERYRHPSEPYELTGIWDVETFLVNGEERIPRTDDALRFQALIIDSKRSGSLKTMDGSQRGVNLVRSKDGERLIVKTESKWHYQVRGEELVLTGEHARVFTPDSEASSRRPELRDPQVEHRLRRDTEFVPEEKIGRRRSRIPEPLQGRWLLESTEIIGDKGTRRHRTPFGWEALVIDATGEVTVQFPLSEQEFKAKATPEGELSLRSSSKFDLELPGQERMRLEGEFRGNDVEIELLLRDPESFLLVRRGFHWVNEVPLGRF